MSLPFREGIELKETEPEISDKKPNLNLYPIGKVVQHRSRLCVRVDGSSYNEDCLFRFCDNTYELKLITYKMCT